MIIFVKNDFFAFSLLLPMLFKGNAYDQEKSKIYSMHELIYKKYFPNLLIPFFRKD